MAEPIAIIGSSCRLPGGANSPSKLWEVLAEPKDHLRKIDRFNADGFYHKDGTHPGHSNVRHAYLLENDIRDFDPQFFGIRPVEAESIDPLQRFLLETVYESLEDAGLSLEGLYDSDTGFFAGVMQSDYTDLLLRDLNTIPQYFSTSSSRSILANRISYVFNWHGPSLVIDTACSSSAVALNSAVQSLQSGECNVAVTAGANLILGPEFFISLSKMNILSIKGRSAMWDKSGNGYGRGEGVVSIVLKRLSNAVRDGDHIDCVIRAIGHNQDGRTQGLTMPSAKAQAALIRQTYAKAGLNVLDPADQPQFFEAHGTGTKAGDPQEAEAIYKSFFEPDGSTQNFSARSENPLWVGGIKTVVGHTEATAGLAGLLKTSVALQAGIIPPNLLFEELNPDIEKFYGPMQIPTTSIPWPTVPKGAPRRASVNSFGFGGANVHVILESYSPTKALNSAEDAASLVPFLFSAHSESSLTRHLSHFKAYLESQSSINLLDLSWTLAKRRSALAVRISFSASSRKELVDKIGQHLTQLENDTSRKSGTRSTDRGQKILGVFTGQGAQWARMGVELLAKISASRETLKKLTAALHSLPPTIRPSWDILEELSRDAKTSNLHQALFSQTLCTALQIILVDVLRASGIIFSAVIGHSSGEIGAAYAAGYLSATDAIRIAYLRGFFASLAQGPHEEKGAMLAASASPEDAVDLCNLPDLQGRLKLAAVNSTSSVTFSGDESAIVRAKDILSERKVFARRLKVDTAYHSHHMEPCAKPYVEALENVDITIQEPADKVTWYSSVYPGEEINASDSLRASYWRDNLFSTVQFLSAANSAITKDGPFQLALEIGPHPALKGPATSILSDLGIEMPYFGVLNRTESDLSSFPDALGSIWANCAGPTINFSALYKILHSESTPVVLKGLPHYSWDHDKPYWYESRRSRMIRKQSDPGHALLGARDDEDNKTEYRWRNFLSLRNKNWLAEHKIQGQIVLPASTYVAMAVEAAEIISGERPTSLVQVEELSVFKPVPLEDENSKVEMITTLSAVTEHQHEPIMTADVTISAHLAKDQSALTVIAQGKLKIVLGEDLSERALPLRSRPPVHLSHVSLASFYASLEVVGYGYTESFRTFSSMERRLNFATGLLDGTGPFYDDDSELLVHPAMLEHAFQALLGASFAPGDGELWSLYLPTGIQKITVDLDKCRNYLFKSYNHAIAIDAWLTRTDSHEIRGDVAFSNRDSTEEEIFIQIEGARMQNLSLATAQDDIMMFAESVWDVAVPNGDSSPIERATSNERELAQAVERIAYYYWRKLEESITATEWENAQEHHRRIHTAIAFNFAKDCGSSFIDPEWQQDDEEAINKLVEKHASSSVDVRLAQSVGRALPSVIRGESTMIEHMRVDNMLDDFYVDGLGFAATNRALARMMRQITHRYPKMDILEVGAGTGGATKAVFDQINGKYSSYTYTDISSGFFETAAERFADEKRKMIFKTLDIEKPPVDQGYTSIYDVVVASNVLHATKSLNNTLQNARSLLKPGGYLVLLEITDNTTIRFSFLMGGLSGWWLGSNDSRIYSPCIAPLKWNQALHKAGFAGIDAISHSKDSHPNPMSVITAQAVDDRIKMIRQPLFKGREAYDDLYILGGGSLTTSKLLDEVLANIGHRFGEIVNIEAVEDALQTKIPSRATVLSILDLDGPLWKDLTTERFKALQHVFMNTHNMLWVSHRQNENPWMNASTGFLRSLAAEVPTLRAQVLDFDTVEGPQQHSRTICEVFLRLLETDEWERESDFSKQLLWVTEPELRFKAGELLVKRVKWHKDNNNRLNCSRRAIERDPHGNSAMQLSNTDDHWALREDYLPKNLPSDAGHDQVEIAVELSTLWMLKLGDEDQSAYIIIGKTISNSEWVATTSLERSSHITANRSQIFAIPEAAEKPAEFLAILMSEIFKARVERSIRRWDGSVVVYEPSELLAQAMSSLTQEKRSCIKVLTRNPTKQGPDSVHVHPRDSQRTLRQNLPKDTHTIVHFENENGADAVDNVIACLPSSAKVLDHTWFIRRDSDPAHVSSRSFAGVDLTLFLKQARAQLQAVNTPSMLNISEIQQISLSDLQVVPNHTSAFTLVNWSNRGSLLVHVGPIKPQRIFKSDKTYILIGMTGETGRSICHWMVRSGAGAVVLTSRNPKIEKAWIDELESTGARVKVAAFDATSKSSRKSFIAEINQELPPVAGMINGAMVLQDRNFHDMEIEEFNRATAAKIYGTIHMDEFFRDTPLDFFIVFSSFSSQIGSRGQTNYNAANAFMASLVQQRRARGLAASTLHLGSLVGVGLLTRDMDTRKLVIDKFGYTPISESNLHHIISQLIMAGLPNSGENSEIITGIREVIEGEERGLHWASNPIFSHLVVPPEQKVKSGEQTKSVVAVRTQLATITSKKEAIDVLTDSFGAKLIAMLQIPEASFRKDAALVGLGVDSLVAIDIRSWFLKEVNLNIAVLKILGGMSTVSLAEYAVEQMPEDMFPALNEYTVPPTAEGGELEPQNASGATDQAISEDPTGIQDPVLSASKNSTEPSLISPQLSTPSSSVSEKSLETAERTSFTQPSSDAQHFDEVEAEAPATKVLRRAHISPAQSRFWFLNMFLEDPTCSNITVQFEIQGRVKVPELKQAVVDTAQAHEVLRSCFLADKTSPERAWLGLMDQTRIEFGHHTISSEVEVKEAYERVRKTRYNLIQGKTMQVQLLSKTLTHHIIIFGYHHIVLDGKGFEAFKTDLERTFTGHVAVPEGRSYFSASESQNEALANGSLETRLEYWQQEYQQIPQLLPLLPVSKVSSRKEMGKYSTSCVEQRLDRSLTDQIKSVCKRFHVTPSHFYLAVFRAVLMRLTDSDTLCVGIADANRHETDVESTVGLFLNMLPLHFKQSAKATFSEILQETRTKVFGGLEHAGVPFDELLKVLNLPRSSSYSPLFQCFYDYHSGTQESFKFSNQKWKITNRNPGERAYDITLDVIEGGAGSLISLIGQDYLYGQDELRKVLNCYIALLTQFVKSPSSTIDKAHLYDIDQVNGAIELGKGSKLHFGWPETLAHRVEEICRKYPEAVALKDGQNKSHLTYRHLQEKAHAIRHELLEAGVQTGDRVVVFQEPGMEWICSLIAIFYAGAVYVPLVTANPLARLNAILKEAGPKVILAHSLTAQMATTLTSKAKIVNISTIRMAEKPIEPTPIAVTGDSPAIILFTSGSTGVPKGIVLRHRNLVNHIEGYVKNWNIEREAVLQQSAYSFDLSIGQIFTALAMGGTLVVAPQAKRGDPVALAQLIRNEKITWTLQTPSEYASLIQFGANDLKRATSWTHALACGETLTNKLVRCFADLGHNVQLYNCYGPAEAIVSATMAKIEYNSFKMGDTVPIGRPNANYSIYVVDKQGNVVPQGFPGEILIGGCGVGIGYLNLPDLTKEKFLQQDRFQSESDRNLGWKTTYRTGDIGRFSKDGNLLYEGRREGDSQVKIRGFRVDLRDIESTLINSSKGVVTEAIVTLRESPEILVVHTVLNKKKKSEDVAGFLATLLADLPLPNYMRPARAIWVDTLPRNLHGKTDRSAVKRLPLPQDSPESDSKAELSPVQQQVAQIWRDALPAELVGNQSIGPTTDFFAVGGNSLLLVMIQSQIRLRLDVSVRLLDLLNVSSLSEMSSLVESSRVIEDVDWERETSIDQNILDLVHESQEVKEPKVTEKTVLLTGATGFLGGFLLSELIQDPLVRTIHCIAVRAKSTTKAEERIPLSANPKVVVHVGDLSTACLGLSKETFASLSAEADLIIHSGARRSFWDNYHEMRTTNVSSTKELVRLAIPRRVPIQFLSTRGVLLLDDSIDPSVESSIADFYPPTQGSDGYVASKWASEVLLEKAGRVAGIPVIIHRFTERVDRPR